MDPISSSNATAGPAYTLTTSATPGTSATAPEARLGKDGGNAASGETGPYTSASHQAGSAEIPEPPAGTPDPGFGQDVLDRSFAMLDKLEKELKNVDPTTPEGAKRMAEITRQLNRLDEMIRMVNEMRKNRHDANMAVIANIAS